MSIDLDPAMFRQILDLMPPLDRRELPAVIAIAQLAAAVDLSDDAAETALLDQLYAIAGITPDSVPPLSPVPTDREERATRIAVLSHLLASQGSRELAYALAYLLSVSDVEISPVEIKLLDELAQRLGISAARANELVDAVARIVTPPETVATAAP